MISNADRTFYFVEIRRSKRMHLDISSITISINYGESWILKWGKGNVFEGDIFEKNSTPIKIMSDE
jgi:hypothetical protein